MDTWCSSVRLFHFIHSAKISLKTECYFPKLEQREISELQLQCLECRRLWPSERREAAEQNVADDSGRPDVHFNAVPALYTFTSWLVSILLHCRCCSGTGYDLWIYKNSKSQVRKSWNKHEPALYQLTAANDERERDNEWVNKWN